MSSLLKIDNDSDIASESTETPVGHLETPLPSKPHFSENLTISISEASALFNMDNTQFTWRYIYSGVLTLNQLHQLHMAAVLRVFDRTPKPERLYWTGNE